MTPKIGREHLQLSTYLLISCGTTVRLTPTEPRNEKRAKKKGSTYADSKGAGGANTN